MNEVTGDDTGFGLVTLEELEREHGTTEFTTTERAILIKLGRWRPGPDPDVPRVGHGYRADMMPEELYASVRLVADRPARLPVRGGGPRGDHPRSLGDRPRELGLAPPTG